MNPWKGLGNLPRGIWILFFTSLINRAGMMVLPFLALYFTNEIGVSEGDAGFMVAVYGLGSLITAPFVGKLSDRIGSKTMMVLSLLGSGFMLILYSFFRDYNSLLFITFFWAVINEAFRPANMSAISEVVNTEQRRTAFALNRLAINLGMSIGPVIGGFLTLIDFNLLFYADALTAFSAGIFLMLSKWKSILPEDDVDENVNQYDQKSLRKTIPLLADKKFLFFFFAIIPVNMVFFQHIGAMPIFIVNYLGYTTAAFGLFSAINTVLIILVEVPLNNLMSNWKYRPSLFWGAMLCGIGFGGFAFTDITTGLVLMIVIWTFGEMIFFPTTAAYISEIAPGRRRGEYMGYFQMTFSLAFTLGPWLGTIVLEDMGTKALWLGALAISVVTAILMLFIHER